MLAREYFERDLTINSSGHLEIGGCDVVELAKAFGTPLYVLDEAKIRANCRAYHEALKGVYPNYELVYAGKAFLTQAMCGLVYQEGFGLDVVSGGELYTALRAGFPAENINFHGNNKSRAELVMALKNGVGRIMVDNLMELETLIQLAMETKTQPRVVFRLKPGVTAHTHTYTQTGQEDSKFGMGLNDGVALKAVKIALASPQIKLLGFHCHIGSQIFEVEPFKAAIDVLTAFMAEARTQTGFVAEVLDLGGGIGIAHNKQEKPRALLEIVSKIGRYARERLTALQYPLPLLVLEPGRSIVGSAGTTIYTVGNIKRIPGVRTYLAVDGGMTDNPRVALYQAVYEGALANKMNEPLTEVVTVTGKCCESGDMLIWDLPLATPEPGDLLAVFDTGAYNYSMASNYNRLPRPAVVLVAEGEAELIVRRETYEQLIQNDLIPERLKVKSEVEPIAK
ncbi:MAG TPA: diaminopimelate decarboxylase [Firmicutes bacterium]|uniref:Diaminopimelate decarboxylase n=1 Tax=Capillibacterium thermochitinicola TaxID=2699427 RepID=A0A8J6I0A1_9FIRM|nr:diaminopimelate decarboxylase [Capillibacterium thermochitinicola]MBA2133245.1 diaminopimelate decarboxylase [Capillibacterium thermochitinicola]HHW11456.1 diaminopimelate decarboxylase [Bacillota bacterium]